MIIHEFLRAKKVLHIFEEQSRMYEKKISYVQEGKFRFNKKIRTKLSFPPKKKNDTTAQLYCTLSTYKTPKTISRQNQKN